jgi:hypothetical protein
MRVSVLPENWSSKSDNLKNLKKPPDLVFENREMAACFGKIE